MKLHLGCGPKFIDGFYHIDALVYPHVDLVGPVESLPTIESGSVTLIYACHLLEHFGRHEVRDVLSEWFRVLTPGGVLRLAVPNFEAVATLYYEKRLDNLQQIMGLVMGGQRDLYDFHKIIFDSTSLTQLLTDAGFSSVAPWNWRETEHSTLDDYSQSYLPHMDKDNGTLMSLNLEATK